MVPKAVIDRLRLAEWRGGPLWEAYIHPADNPEIVNLPDPLNNLQDDYSILMHALDVWSRKSAQMGKFCEALKDIAVWHEAGIGYRTGNYGRAVLRHLDAVEAAL